MESIRERAEKLEARTLSPLAALSGKSRGRERAERNCKIRTAFQRDRDRIVHSKAFRRLKHKTQVFLAPKGDHYRTRLTHTIEVSQIARTISRALMLNEDLTEAIALGHDLGHTPFGHAGEDALNEVHEGGFHHWEQSLRVVEELAGDGKGLNLCWEVRDGILKHSKGRGRPVVGGSEDQLPATMEGRVVRVADIVAYTNHDLQDAISAGLVKPSDVPRQCVKTLGSGTARRINAMVTDIVMRSAERADGQVAMSDEVREATEALREWLFQTVYFNDKVRDEFEKSRHIIHGLYRYYLEDPHTLARHAHKKKLSYGVAREACDHIAGMSDSYALHIYEELFMPKPWSY